MLESILVVLALLLALLILVLAVIVVGSQRNQRHLTNLFASMAETKLIGPLLDRPKTVEVPVPMAAHYEQPAPPPAEPVWRPVDPRDLGATVEDRD